MTFCYVILPLSIGDEKAENNMSTGLASDLIAICPSDNHMTFRIQLHFIASLFSCQIWEVLEGSNEMTCMKVLCKCWNPWFVNYGTPCVLAWCAVCMYTHTTKGTQLGQILWCIPRDLKRQHCNLYLVHQPYFHSQQLWSLLKSGSGENPPTRQERDGESLP